MACGKKFIIGFQDTFLMRHGQDQQQHPNVHSGVLALGRSIAVAVGVSDKQQVICDARIVIPDR